MSFLNTMDITASALTAGRFRMDIIAQNLANIDTTRTETGDPYRRKLVVYQERGMTFAKALDNATEKASGGGVRVADVIEDESEFIPVYDPAHPDADEDGYILKPNVDRAEESVDLMAASHSYNANITALNVIKAMASKATEIMK